MVEHQTGPMAPAKFSKPEQFHQELRPHTCGTMYEFTLTKTKQLVMKNWENGSKMAPLMFPSKGDGE
jgi:hypothetical protein